MKLHRQRGQPYSPCRTLYGAWIEIPADATSLPTFCVAPHIGAWIEIQTACLFP
ncbi:hypothetical protein [Bacillus cereus]|uniref:hypothetical protein n=1 Tax=Bacillus cereus TaxID=1396 RepID=UPI0018F66D62|nr:hypothetical protein [Bacillus cereus]MBJ7967585.1 hypothetical protein [Bacillus cereus]MBJ8003928.1 hypothetical protein [Bacillus cereus]